MVVDYIERRYAPVPDRGDAGSTRRPGFDFGLDFAC